MQYSLITLVIAAATFVSATPMPQAGSFAAQNIPVAQAQNDGFATLTPGSSCDAATQPEACINDEFVQCVGGVFSAGISCGSLKCFALPLVNKAGTTVTCTTDADAAARLTPAGGAAPAPVAGGATAGTDNAVSGGSTATAPVVAAPAAPAAPAAGNPESIRLAIAENASFQGLSAGSACDAATQAQACVGGNFAQCVNGEFVVGAGCGAGLKCFSLPLVNSVGTSVTCTTEEDATRRGVN